MAKVHWHTVEQFYEMLYAGVIENNAMRIAKWLHDHGDNGLTRNYLCTCVFNVIYDIDWSQEGCPKGLHKALDGGPPIKWRSIDGGILWLLRENPNEVALIHESIYTVKDEHSDTKRQAKLLFPIGVPHYKIKLHPSKWPPQMEMPL